MANMGRPRKEIDRADFEGLLSIQCTLEEVAFFLDHKLGGCSTDTIERWCKRTYKKSFAEISAQYKALGRISLRRMQWQKAKNSDRLLIWLGKQYLGQKNKDEDW